MGKFFRWIKNKFNSLMIIIGLSLYRVENDILKSDYRNLGKKDEINRRWYSRFQFLENFAKGQRDEKYVKDFYEILKKSDEYLRSANEHKMRVSADKYVRSYGKYEDEFFGYFDPKHKYFGKTFKEVESEIMSSKRVINDNYEILHIINNKPIVKMETFEEKDFYTKEELFRNLNKIDFPIKIHRSDDNVINKIETITEYLHIKRIGLDLCYLEFIIPIKFNTKKFDNDSDIIKELITFDEVFFRKEYGELYGFKITQFVRREIVKNKDDKEVYEVFIFKGEIIMNM